MVKGNNQTQNYLILQPVSNKLRVPTGNTDKQIPWKSKRFLDASINPHIKPANSFAPKLKLIQNSKISVEFRVSCLRQDKVTFTNDNVVKFFIVYKLDTWSRDLKADSRLRWPNNS